MYGFLGFGYFVSNINFRETKIHGLCVPLDDRYSILKRKPNKPDLMILFNEFPFGVAVNKLYLNDGVLINDLYNKITGCPSFVIAKEWPSDVEPFLGRKSKYKVAFYNLKDNDTVHNRKVIDIKTKILESVELYNTRYKELGISETRKRNINL